MADLLFDRLATPRRPRNFNYKQKALHDYTDEELIRRYRFGRESINFICNLLTENLSRNTRRNQALQPIDQVLTALRFYASGAFLQVIGDTFGFDKATVSRSITAVTNALVDKQSQYIKWPTGDKLSSIKNHFYEVAGFPAVFGCVDGTHIRVQAPRDDEKGYINRKGYHSINVQGICDHEGLFTNVVARWPGSAHDSHVFRSSNVCQHLERSSKLEDGWLLGDSGYGCRPFLMTPYSRPKNPAQEAYNASHTRTRVVIEQTFGRWKRRFHVLHSEIRMDPEKVCRIVAACAVLHNIAIMFKEPMIDAVVEEDQPHVEYNGPQQGLSLRRSFTQKKVVNFKKDA